MFTDKASHKSSQYGIVTDQLNATSATALPIKPYTPVYKTTIFSNQNPYGSEGQFRNIYIEYNMAIPVTF